MTYDTDLRDTRAIARIVNLAHRLGCRPTRIDAEGAGPARAHFTFSGEPAALLRLRAQIDRIVAAEGVVA